MKKNILKILGIAGSLRKESFNKKLLGYAKSILPDEAEMEIFDLEGMPLFNQDLEIQMPDIPRELKQKIREADGILIVTPEYNYSVPGVLKNAIDWASRPYGDNAWNEKPTAIMGASTSGFGTLRAQLHLRQIFQFINVNAVRQPEVYISNAMDKFDEEGILISPQDIDKVKLLLENLIKEINK